MKIVLLTMLLLSSCSTQFSESVYEPAAGINGSFESVKNGLPVNWLVSTPATAGSGHFFYTYDTTSAIDGKQSLCIDVINCSSDGGRFSPGIAQEINVREGEEYEVSFSVKNQGTSFKICAFAISPNTRNNGLLLQSSKSFNDWHKFSHPITVPKGYNKLRFEVSITQPGKFWIDDIRIRKVNKG